MFIIYNLMILFRYIWNYMNYRKKTAQNKSTNSKNSNTKLNKSNYN